ncbi:MAG TPA: hypothetical protein VMW69_16685, partial [Spirochaetia bacterium]|nr:hypothetical protein [Spirochaetia bacterium]
KIDTPLPQEQAPALPEIDIALPKAQNIELGAAAYEVPVPAQGPSGAPITAAVKPTSNFFSDGLIGAGSMNHIIGDVTLYKLGANPRFNIEFSHERIDGYFDPSQPLYFWPAGAGFFNRTDALVGSLTTATGNGFSLDTHDFYRETENGLQGLDASKLYSSVTHRFISGDLNATYSHLAPVTFGAGVLATSGDMSLASPSPSSAINAQELSVKPTLSIGLNLAKVTGDITGFYELRGNSGRTQYQQQAAGGSLALNAELPLALTFSGSVGAHWDDTVGWAVPFSLELDGVYKDLLTYRLYGGYKVSPQDYFDLWTKYPYLNHDQVLSSSLDWYGGVATEWRFGKNLALQGGLDFSNVTNAILPTTLAGDGTGLFEFTQGAATTLSPSAAFSWDPSGPFSMKIGWKGNFLKPVPFTPLSGFNLDAQYDDSTGRFGGALTGVMDLYSPSEPATLMPNLGLSGYFRVSDGVTFHLDMNDLLSPLLSTGRKSWNTYTDPGFRVTVTTQISL